MTSYSFYAMFFLLVTIIEGVGHEEKEVDLISHGCRRLEEPSGSRVTPNRDADDDWKPIYLLTFTHDEDQRYDYNIDLHVPNHSSSFRDCVLSAESNDTCGVGTFIFQDDDFFRVTQSSRTCPYLITTNRKTAMTRLPPLKWKMPSCGCVHIRVMVMKTHDQHFIENNSVENGPLTYTICGTATDKQIKPIMQFDLEDLLCRVTKRDIGLGVLQRHSFLSRRRLHPRYLYIPGVNRAFNDRRKNVVACCNQAESLKKECFANIRRRRIDEICEDGSPEIPFTLLRSRFMRQCEDECCWKLGESRYDCFQPATRLLNKTSPLDYSLDETDPLNDIVDYAEEITELVNEETELSYLEGTRDQSFPKAIKTTKEDNSSEEIDLRKAVSKTQSRESLIPFPKRSFISFNGLTTIAPFVLRNLRNKEHSLDVAMKKERNIKKHKIDVTEGENFDDENIKMVKTNLPVKHGGTSIEQTFFSLRKQIWKLSLRTQCCQAGARASGGRNDVIEHLHSECLHNSDKYSEDTLGLKRGYQLCSTQFYTCCTQTSIRVSTDVVTLGPDHISSQEWDGDRIFGNLYHPPYERVSSKKLHHPKADVLRTKKNPSTDVNGDVKFPVTERKLSLSHTDVVDPQIDILPELTEDVDDPEIDIIPELAEDTTSEFTPIKDSREKIKLYARKARQNLNHIRKEKNHIKKLKKRKSKDMKKASDVLMPRLMEGDILSEKQRKEIAKILADEVDVDEKYILKKRNYGKRDKRRKTKRDKHRSMRTMT